MRRALPALPVLAALVAYAMAPWAELVWDDKIIALQMASVRGVAGAFLPPDGIQQWSYEYYRPVVILSYLLDLRLFGSGTAGPHAVNVACHALATAGVALLLHRLLAHRPHGALAATAAATLFAVHPIHTESVSWIAGRSDVLATLFLVPALHLLVAWRDRSGVARLGAATLLFAAALLAKEVALAGLVLAPLLVVFAAPAPGAPPPARPWRDAAIAGAAWLAVAALYLAVRSLARSVPAPPEGELPTLAAQLLRATGWYVVKLAWPFPQSNFVTWDMVPGVAVAAVVGLAALAALAGAGLAAARALRTGAPRPGAGAAAIAAGWALAAIGPSLALAVAAGSENPVAERYLYLPSVGLCLAAGLLLARSWQRSGAVVAAVATVLLAMLVGTWVRGVTWMRAVSLWTDTTARAPLASTAWGELGQALVAAGDVRGAQLAFERAATVAGRPLAKAVAAFNLGTFHERAGDGAAARAQFEAAVAADPTYPWGHLALGRILLRGVGTARTPGAVTAADAMRVGDAVAHLGRAVALYPGLVEARLVLAEALTVQGDIARFRGDFALARASYVDVLRQIGSVAALDPAVASQPAVQERRAAVIRLLRGP